ncbi:transposase [Pantoea dispersa]|uniref:IS66-like element accessory protein TnpA n=1 Tax=Pantoea dispersa TaxID=59814 RepID=UPI000F663B57|nr:transposase [Pantoea dispersa]RRW59351.1 transposase [Pantoea dispersa]
MTDFKSLPRQRYTPEFKLRLVRMALKTLEQNGSVAALAREHNVNDNLLFKWIRLWKNEGRVAKPRGRKAKPAALPALVPVQIVHPLPAPEPKPGISADCVIRLPGGEISLHNPSPEQLSAMLQAMMRGGRS